MKRSVTLISTLTVLILLLLMVPIVIPKDAVSAAVSDNVTLASIKNNEPCTSTFGSSASVRSGETFTCNLTVGGDATGFVNAKIRLYVTGSSTYTKEIPATFPINITAAGYTNIQPVFYMSSAAEVPARAYDIDAWVQPNGGSSWVTSPGKLSITVNNTAPSVPVVTPLAACVNTVTPIFAWTAASGAATYTLVLDGTDNVTCITGTSVGPSTSPATKAMTQATHTWAIKAVDGAGNYATSAAQTICIDSDPPDNPGGSWVYDGDTFPGGYNPTENWTASEDDSLCAGVRYWVQTDNVSNSFGSIVDNVTVSGTSYTRGALLPAGKYYWHVRAFDCAGNLSTGWNGPWNFTMPASSAIPYSINLSTGWNLISLPVIPDVSSTSTIASRISPTGAASLIFTYDCGSTAFKFWDFTYASGTLQDVVDGKSYWFYATAPCTLSGTGRACPAAPGTGSLPTIYRYTLCYLPTSSPDPDGWNMLGFKCTQNMLASQYLSDLGTTNPKYSSLYSYSGGGWRAVQPSEYMIPGVGYYIQMNASGKITPPCY